MFLSDYYSSTIVDVGRGGKGDRAMGANNDCTSFCNDTLSPGFGGRFTYDPYYIKCYDAYNLYPLNSMRISLDGDTRDPSIPRMTLWNFSACYRIKLILSL